MAGPPSHSSTRRIGRYELLEQLGRGGTGVVYLARDTVLGREVALKVLRFPAPFDEEEADKQRRRFRREARTAGRLSHPHVVTIYDTGEDPESGAFYIAMEHVDGIDLRTVLTEQGSLDISRAVNLATRLADALDYLHDRGIVHRDIKPANVLLAEDGRVKLTDFGIALFNDPEITHELAVLGTPAYIAPEQMQGRDVDHRVDVFALGVMVHEMLTAAPPFEGDTVAEVVHRVLSEPFDPHSGPLAPYPVAVREVVARALEKSPDRRWSSAGEMAAALHTAVIEHSEELPVDERSTTLDLAPGLSRRRPSLRRRVEASKRRLAQRFPRSSVALRRVGQFVSLQRVVAAAAMVSAVLFGLYGLGHLLLVETGAPLEASSGPFPEYRILLEETRAHLEAGQPQHAALFLELADRLAPDREWERHRLRQALAASNDPPQVEEHLEEARRALAEGRYQDVLAGTRELLSLQLGDEELVGFLAAVERELERGSRPAPRTPASQAIPSELETPGDLAPGPQPLLATLTIELHSEVPEGILVAFLDDRQILRRSFSFHRRSGLFGREPQAGSFTEAVEVGPGEHTLQLSLLRADEPPTVRSLTLELEPGQEAVVEVWIDEDGHVMVSLDDRWGPEPPPPLPS